MPVTIDGWTVTNARAAEIQAALQHHTSSESIPGVPELRQWIQRQISGCGRLVQRAAGSLSSSRRVFASDADEMSDDGADGALTAVQRSLHSVRASNPGREEANNGRQRKTFVEWRPE